MKQTETVISLTVSTEQAGERVDRLLSQIRPEMSRSRIQALIKGGQASADSRTITNPSYRVKHSQRLSIIIPPPQVSKLVPQTVPLTIPFEDDGLLVVDKQPGLAVHPAPGTPDMTLVNALLEHCGDSLSGIGGELRPGIVHRLDKDTSGLIVIAKNDFVHAALSKQFQAREVTRSYAAVVWGIPNPSEQEIYGNIGRNQHDRKKMAVVDPPNGRTAITRYRMERKFDSGQSLLECHLRTGRTHQIRVHLAHMGHPLIGDKIYGRKGKKKLGGMSVIKAQTLSEFPRQALHAQVLGFMHPTKQVPMHFKSELPYDIMELIKTLQDV